MAGKKKPTNTAEHILSEAQGNRSREAVTVTGGTYVAGQVMGKITADDKYTGHDPAASDGSENAVAILYEAVDASSEDQKATVHVRDCEYIDSLLAWKDGITEAQKTTGRAKLAESGMIAR